MIDSARVYWDELLRAIRRALPEKTPHAQADAEAKTEERECTAFVLLGGGSHGAAQAGALSELVAQGITPDIVIGVSAGSWNGAFWTLNPTAMRARVLEAIWASANSRELLGAVPWRAAITAVTNHGAIYDNDGMRKFAERHLGSLTFADTRIPLRILSVNVSRGLPALLNTGSLIDAVLASSAIPGVFPPVEISGDRYVDGGLMEEAACDAAVAYGATTIYVISCGSMTGRIAKIDTMTDLLNRSLEVNGHFRFLRMVDELRRRNINAIAIHPEIPFYSALDFDRSGDLIQAGHIAARAALAEIAAAAQ